MDEDNSDALNDLISSLQEKLGNDIPPPPQEDNNDSFNFDPSMIFKAQKIFSKMNGNNPKKNLLLSLKPFLRQSRQDKMNDYITILNIISGLEAFKNDDKGRD